MVITETIQKSMQRAQEDIRRNAKEYRRQCAEKTGQSQGDYYEQAGDNEFYCFTYDKDLVQEAMNLGMRGDYLREMQAKKKEYEKGVYTQGSRHDFSTDVMGSLYAYSELYQEIVNGHADGTRKRYQYDRDAGKMREMTVEEELSLLNQDYEQLISMKMLAITSQMIAQENLKFYNQPHIAEQYNRQQVTAYIADSGAAIRNHFVSQYDTNPAQAVRNIKSMVLDVLHGNKGMFDYCTALNAQIEYMSGNSYKRR